jgi:hypothetical protein
VLLPPPWVPADRSEAAAASGGVFRSAGRAHVPRPSYAGSRAGRQRQSVQTWAAEVPFPSWAGSRTRQYE